MKQNRRWVIVDTETDGLYEPIHVVELSGQLMEGWHAIGEPFRMLLNHDVPIDPAATAIHGYTREYLREHGHQPQRVYELFRDYAQDYPLVAHNLSFDWNRCLEPEWRRLGVTQIGQRGFCSMLLARRLVTETNSYRLEALKQCFQLTPSRSHQAENDVLTVVELFQKVYRPRLESAQIDTFDAIAAFTKQTPVAKCLAMIRNSSKVQTKQATLKDEWYFLDVATNPHGPLPARDVVAQSAGLDAYYVWREGMADWEVNQTCAEFLALCQPTLVVDQASKKLETTKTMSELIGLCRGIIADNKVTTAEVMFLNSWLQDVGFLSEWPASEIAQTMERILEDGVVTKEEKNELKQLLQRITGTSVTPEVETQRQIVEASDFTETASIESVPYTIVSLDQGTPEWLEWRQNGIGASDAPVIMGENPWKDLNELLRQKRGAIGEQVENAAMARGTMLEPEARKRYMLQRGVQVRPACLQSTQYEWLRASVDGISFDKSVVVEIKCGDSVYRKTALTGRPPDYYYGQLQHIMAVTGFTTLDFWCYLPNRPELLVSVNRDEGYIKRLLEAEYNFWQQVIS